LAGLAASAGAASTETASSAAEMVFNMVVSSFNGDHEVAGRGSPGSSIMLPTLRAAH
jgi:hypothetical protein